MQTSAYRATPVEKVAKVTAVLSVSGKAMMVDAKVEILADALVE